MPGLTAAQVWPQLNEPFRWPGYYGYAADIAFHDGAGPELGPGVRFRFTTFGFPVEAEVTEYQPPVAGQPARQLAATRPNPMLNAHQAWIDGLADSARRVS